MEMVLFKFSNRTIQTNRSRKKKKALRLPSALSVWNELFDFARENALNFLQRDRSFIQIVHLKLSLPNWLRLKFEHFLSRVMCHGEFCINRCSE